MSDKKIGGGYADMGATVHARDPERIKKTKRKDRERMSERAEA